MSLDPDFYTKEIYSPRVPSVDLIEFERHKSLGLLSQLDQAILDRRTVASRWSPGEVFDHLIKFDNFFLENARQLVSLARDNRPTRLSFSLQELDVGPACIPKGMLPLFTVPLTIASAVIPKPIQSVLAGSLPIKHPQFATPARSRPKLELQEDLEKTLSEYLQILGSPTQHDFSQMTISHPLLGNRNLLELPEFVAVHERRHFQRMTNLLNSPKHGE